jgi:hypothetical protein
VAGACHRAWWKAARVVRLNDPVRHHRAEDDEPTGRPPADAGGWALSPPDDGLDDDLEPARVWESGGPGSASAAARGCLCPVLPNDPRAGLGVLIAPDCPVHRAQPG